MVLIYMLMLFYSFYVLKNPTIEILDTFVNK